MRNTMKNIGIISLILASLAVASPAYTHQQKQPSMGDMMKGGGMEGMMGMMGMMEQMNKMMGVCTKMMESSMDGKERPDKKPMESPAEPEKKG